MAEVGYVTMRNEDGTQYAAIMFGNVQWVECKRDATKISREVFAVMEAAQEDTRKRDCPDNGFFGVYNLRFHPAG
jgi:hypothetical protein